MLEKVTSISSEKPKPEDEIVEIDVEGKDDRSDEFDPNSNLRTESFNEERDNRDKMSTRTSFNMQNTPTGMFRLNRLSTMVSRTPSEYYRTTLRADLPDAVFEIGLQRCDNLVLPIV